MRQFRYLVFCTAALACASVPVLSPRTTSAAAANGQVSAKIDRLDPGVNLLVPPDATLEKEATGFIWTEGPLWLPTGKLIFAEIGSNSIRAFTPGSGTAIFLQPSGYRGHAPYGGPEPGSNAMTFDQQGRISIAGHAQRNVWRLERVDPHAQVTVLADAYQGKRLNSPNDLVYRSDGSLYFTDPPYGLRKQNDSDPEKELPFGAESRCCTGSRPPAVADS